MRNHKNDLSYCLIINPNAGNSDQKVTIDLIKRKFSKRELKIMRTTKAGDATAFARESNYDVVIAAGGDGTVNEVINGLVRLTKDGFVASRKLLGIIPIGTANMFAKHLRVPSSVSAACDVILRGNVKPVDLGQMNGKLFTCAAGIGLDAHCFQNATRELKKNLGPLAYPVAMLKSAFEYEARKLKVTVGEMHFDAYYVIICNVGNYGFSVKFFPDAKIDDGFLDLLIFQNKDIPNRFRYGFGVLSQSHTMFKDVKRVQCRKVKVTGRNVLCHVDAEVGGSTPVSASVLPAAVNIIYPSKKAAFDVRRIVKALAKQNAEWADMVKGRRKKFENNFRKALNDVFAAKRLTFKRVNKVFDDLKKVFKKN